MSIHPLFTLTIENSTSNIILTPCPGTKNVDLISSLQQIKASGAVALLTFMTQGELDKNHLSDLGEVTKAQGLLGFICLLLMIRRPESRF